MRNAKSSWRMRNAKCLRRATRRRAAGLCRIIVLCRRTTAQRHGCSHIHECEMQHEPQMRNAYEGLPVNKSPGVNKPPPGGPRGGAGSATSIFKRSLACFARNFFDPNSCVWVFNGCWWFSHQEPRNRGEGEGQGWRGLINFGPKAEASLWGRAGFIHRRSPIVGISLVAPQMQGIGHSLEHTVQAARGHKFLAHHKHNLKGTRCCTVALVL
jgi:hypothetical protein